MRRESFSERPAAAKATDNRVDDDDVGYDNRGAVDDNDGYNDDNDDGDENGDDGRGEEGDGEFAVDVCSADAGFGGGENKAAAAVGPFANEHNERIFRRLMPNYQQKEPMSCELCGDVLGMPVSYHMLTTHPGCGHSSGGRGYTSNGVYKTGWSGACGEGGIAWYLLCESCRGNYMKRAAKSVAPASGPVRSRKTGAVVYRGGASSGDPSDHAVNRKLHGKS